MRSFGREGRDLLVRKSAPENGAKRNKGQTIENKRFGEIVDSASSMISMTCDYPAQRFHFVWRNEALRFRRIGQSGARK
jgi:hypothetical protein